MAEYHLRPATESDIERSWAILQQGKAQMFRNGKKQWTEHYPSRDSVVSDLAKGYAYVLDCDGVTVAYGAVVFDGEPAYEQIAEKWLSSDQYVVLHRLAVADEVKRQGVAATFFRKIMDLAVAKGVYSFKVDTNYDNEIMLRLLKSLGFVYCGDVMYSQGARMAFELLLK